MLINFFNVWILYSIIIYNSELLILFNFCFALKMYLILYNMNVKYKNLL